MGDLEGPVNIRPKRLDEYIGQTKVKESLKIAIEAAKGRGEPLDHLLFYGPPGLGKTTLSRIIANEMEAEIHLTSGPALERAGDLATILTNLENHDILFIDEIHRMNRMVEETIYPAMEDFKIDMVTGKGPSARTFRLDLNHFTLIGATTRAGLLTNPLRERFGILHPMNFYEVSELQQIIDRTARILGTPIVPDASEEIARRSRGTPRIANRLLKRVRDYAEVKGTGEIVLDISMEALDSLGVDPLGLDDLDRRFLMVIIENYSGGPVGVEAIAATLPEEVDTITEVIEPYLLKAGLVNRTPRGRTATVKAYEHLGLKPPLSDQNSLF